MALTLPSRKTLALTLAGLAVFYLLFAWLALPRIIQTEAEKFIAEKTGHRLTMDRPEFNPFKNSLRLTGLRLAQPNGEPLLAFRELVVDMSVASIFRGAFVFDGIHLDGLEATVVMQPDGRNNWSALIDALKSKDKTPESALPRLDIHRLVLAGARLDFTDMWTAPVFATRIEPINLELTDISTLSDDKGWFKVAARTIYGATVTWQGKASLEPPVVTGSIGVEDVDIARLATYIKDVLPIAPPAGIFGVSADYRFAYAGGRPELNIEHITAKLTGLRLQGNRDTDPSVAVDSIEAKEGRFDLVKNSFTLGNISATGGRLNLERGKDGSPKALELGSLVLDDVRVDLGHAPGDTGPHCAQGWQRTGHAGRNGPHRYPADIAVCFIPRPRQTGSEKKDCERPCRTGLALSGRKTGADQIRRCRTRRVRHTGGGTGA